MERQGVILPFHCDRPRCWCHTSKSQAERAKWERFPPLQGRVHQPESVRGVGYICDRDTSPTPPTDTPVPKNSETKKNREGSNNFVSVCTCDICSAPDFNTCMPDKSVPEKTSMQKNTHTPENLPEKKNKSEFNIGDTIVSPARDYPGMILVRVVTSIRDGILSFDRNYVPGHISMFDIATTPQVSTPDKSDIKKIKEAE